MFSHLTPFFYGLHNVAIPRLGGVLKRLRRCGGLVPLLSVYEILTAFPPLNWGQTKQKPANVLAHVRIGS